ncbi:MAG: NADP-reducing hydrogenase subunit HndD [Clostridiales bacterium]|nr:NADP-reducing hydrogenase subunit HndD [Clostridiales bacterium]MDN5281398.1 NADP-reducing hydrogenase subunit HndD [Candidatus Ozemobacter sp.]
MIQIEVNNRKIDANKGELLLTAIRRAGVAVPTLCHYEGLPPSGACRMCVVEMDGRLVPSCAVTVNEGMKCMTHSAKAVKARKTIIELLLADHPDDCLYCVRNGNCELQTLAEEYGVRTRRYDGAKSTCKLDISSPALERDPAKCILCGKCVRVCEEVQNVSAIDFAGRGSKTRIEVAFNDGINMSSCVYCGQCIKVCPTGALREKSSIKEVLEAIADPDKYVVVQHAPAISVSVGEAFGMKAGADCSGALNAALRRIGFDRVFDTSFTADLTIMEEGAELVSRIKNGGKLPMLTSCSPGWVKFAEEFYPDMLENLSSCKSPQQMMGAVIKSYFAEKEKIDPKKIYSVSIMPCTAKKFEVTREEMLTDGNPDIDAVLTNRELVRLLKMRGLDLNSVDPEGADTPFGTRTGAGKIFGTSGGVMEAALRSGYYLLTGKELESLDIKSVRGVEGRKESKINIDGVEIGVAVVSGLKNASDLLDEIRAGRDDLHFIEIMACPGGCINGGGQPIGVSPDAVKARMKGLYSLDKKDDRRASHHNPDIKKLYEEYLGEPLGHKSHKLLHTHYRHRDVVK